MAFLVQNYHDKSQIYDDTSKVEWKVSVFENMDDGSLVEVQQANAHKCHEDDYT
jgi:hypothetical protein